MIWQAPFSFSILILLTDNKWFDTPWGCYLINSATLIFITFKMSKHPTFVECHFWNFSEPPNTNLQLLNLRLEFGFCLRKKDNYNGILAFFSLEFMYILKLRNSPSYNTLVWETTLFLCFRCFLQINDLTRLGVGIYEIQQSW